MTTIAMIAHISMRVRVLIGQIGEKIVMVVGQRPREGESEAMVQTGDGRSAAVESMVPNGVKVPVHRMRDGRSAMRRVVVIRDAMTPRADSIIIATTVPPTVIGADLVRVLEVQVSRRAVETAAVRNSPRTISPSPIHRWI
jgi:hypothetical protein